MSIDTNIFTVSAVHVSDVDEVNDTHSLRKITIKTEEGQNIVLNLFAITSDLNTLGLKLGGSPWEGV